MGRRLNQPSKGEQAVLSLRIDFADGKRLGPGKVRLLEAIAEHGSISAAGRAIGMSYKRAWDLIEEMNSIFASPVVESHSGGSKGGGAALTPSGKAIIILYRRMERRSATASKDAMAELLAKLR